MKLIEVVVSDQTSEETRDRALSFARQIGKLPVLVRDRPGFLVNRVLFPYLLDAAELFESGVALDQIDQPRSRAARRHNRPLCAWTRRARPVRGLGDPRTM